jgi:3beta-hydroxy-delta5-steroid dehydrogenase/steroid delta-isomerase
MGDSIPAAPILRPEEIGRCLVTGGAGYLGSALVRRLRATGCQVRSLDVLPHKHEPGVEIVAGDLRNFADVKSACEGIDTVFHTAALMTILSLYRRHERDLVWGVNVTGTENIVRAAQEGGAKTFVHTS